MRFLWVITWEAESKGVCEEYRVMRSQNYSNSLLFIVSFHTVSVLNSFPINSNCNRFYMMIFIQSHFFRYKFVKLEKIFMVWFHTLVLFLWGEGRGKLSLESEKNMNDSTVFCSKFYLFQEDAWHSVGLTITLRCLDALTNVCDNKLWLL